MNILFFGDSITQGFSDSEGGWVSRIRKYYDIQAIRGDNTHKHSIYNLGIDGDTSLDLADRLEYDAEARDRYSDMAVVIAIGMNDSLLREGENISTPKKFVENLEDIVDIARYYSSKILFVGLTPIDDKLLRRDDDVEYFNHRIELFDTELQKFCDKEHLPYVKVFEEFARNHEIHGLLRDGLHPNEMGHHLIASLVLPELHTMIS